MKNKNITILKDIVEQKFLSIVRRPARYIGGEVNQITKDLSKCDLTVGLCFPDIYDIAMSNMGLAVLYNILNKMPAVAAERVHLPWSDAEEILRKENIPLFSLESKAAVADFDVLGFSLNNELCYTNVLNLLDLAGLELRTADRKEHDPVIIAGGQTSNCAEPIAPFIDMFILGDGEDATKLLAEFFIEHKKAETPKRDMLIDAARKFPFVYVPSLYTFEYDGDKIKSFTADVEGIPTRIVNAVVDDFDSAPVPESPIIPYAEAVHERVSIEVMRGCPGRCRFCQASYCRRPIRYRSVDRIVDLAKKQYAATGFDTVSLLSLSTADYPHLEELLEKLQEYFTPRRVGISLPSLRVKEQLKLLPKMASTVRKSGLTIAVEAASEKLRTIIDKPITNEDLFAAVTAAYKAGFQRVKLYFMVGFPCETEEDIIQIADLACEICTLKKQVDNRFAQVTAAVSWLVPKPHTPFGYIGQQSAEYFERAKQLIIKRKYELNAKSVRFNFHETDRSVLESAIGRGDRRIADVIESAYRGGATFDLWDECFNDEIWQQAFKKHGIDPSAAAQKSYNIDDIMPWAHLGGPDEKTLRRHYNDAMKLANQ